jgi:membrane protease YdiL (CAAX protease family)
MSSLYGLQGAARLRSDEAPLAAPAPVKLGPLAPGRPPGFGKTVWILLRSARKRAVGRQQRQQQLLNQKAKKEATDWGALAAAMTALFMLILSGLAAGAVIMGVRAGERVEAERSGRMEVSASFMEEVRSWDQTATSVYKWPGGESRTESYHYTTSDSIKEPAYKAEAHRIAEDEGGSEEAIAERLKAAYTRDGVSAFVRPREVEAGMDGLVKGGVGALLGSVLLLLWAGMLVAQGEGLELDLQRQRHPMWEWLHAHPVMPGAIFLAEMLAPIAANPIYWGGPLFVGIVIGDAQGPLAGLGAALVVGFPLTVALACLGKALEIAITLRLSPRTRGAMIGLIGWFGYASMMVFFLALMLVGKVATALRVPLLWMAAAPSPWLRWFVGLRADGTYSLALAMVVDVGAAVALGAAAVGFSVWGARQGLAGNFAAEAAPARRRSGSARFGREPLYRKELLWFVRDRSAVVQTILIPITVASFQLFNLRWVLQHAQGAWNYLCGVAIFFGTYFLWILGPKSLQSEGQALWIALTWPRGLESLLKAKARLWSLLSSAMVLLVLGYAAWVFPRKWWQIALVGVGWFVFAGSMAEKAVTLVTVTSESGETAPIPRGRRGAAQLGMLTFAIGVVGQQWHIAVMGIVYSWMTAAAMWQNFRARLPYLYDPWSEVLPEAPTLMHAMVAISLLVEGGAVFAGVLVAVMGPGGLGVALALAHAVCAVAVSVGLASFLGNRGVTMADVWEWHERRFEAAQGWLGIAGLNSGEGWLALLVGLGGGLALGAAGHAYVLGLRHIPALAEMLSKSQHEMARLPGLQMGYAIAAVGFAPWAEEYLFRGVLYRALDREWGGWKAVVGSAAFFATYHQPLAWPPVFALGVANALLFKRTRRLMPCVVLHMAYNAVVLMGS